MSASEELPEDIVKKESLNYSSIDELSDESGRMKQIYRVKTKDRGSLAIYKYKKKNAGERGRTVSQRIKAEIHSFKAIKEKTNLRTPEIISSDGESYLLCDWLDGENTGKRIENGENKGQLAKNLGEALESIHSIQYQLFGEVNRDGVDEGYQSWTAFLKDLIVFMKQIKSEDIVQIGIQYLENNIEMVQGENEPVLVHGDYHAWNTVINQKQELGILDCEASFVGCREFEINRALGHWLEDNQVSEQFLDGYGRENLRKGWKNRKNFYNILHATMGLIDGFRLRSEHLRDINRRWLEKELDKI